MLDAIKDLGFRYASKSGITVAINDIEVSEEKEAIVGEAERKVSLLEQQYMDGLITENERYSNAVQIWTEANDTLTKVIETNLHKYGGIYLMATSGGQGKHRADQADGRHERPDVRPERPYHRPAHQVQLPGGSERAGVLHLHARR